MRQGWEVKKLKDVAVLITDGDWIESKHQSDTGIRLIQTGNIGSGVFKAKEDKPHYISEETFKELGCNEIFTGDCLVSRLPEPVGRACIIPEVGNRMITAVDCSIIRFKGIVLPKLFIYYSQSSSYQRDINNNTTGTTRKRISRKNLEQIPIPVPPLPEQEKIVAELDCLSGIIEKKKQQLKELDALAQSIFYEMFGDPVENEKGWEVAPLNNACEKIGDGLHGTPQYDKNGLIPFINGTNLENGRIKITDKTQYVNEIEARKFHIEMNDSTVLLSINGTLGKTALYNEENVILGKSVCYCNLKEILLPTFVIALMQTNAFKQFLEDNSSKSTIKNVGLKAIRGFGIILPPLSLQHSFASKVEAIEKQKELIKQSIAETELLFNSRMQYYFG